jgi:hypothetical protein
MKLAQGLRKIVDQYGDRILAATGGWVEWDSPLGCGHFGCVWALANMDPGYNSAETPFKYTGRVLKISVDPTEGPVVAAIMKTGLDKQLDGLARWEGVWRIPAEIGTRAGRNTGWVIIREEIRPFPMSLFFSAAGHRWNKHLHKYNEKIRKAIDLKTERNREAARDEAMQEVGYLGNYEETYYVAEAIEALARKGIILADIHTGNLGSRVNPTEDQPLVNAYWSDKTERPALLIFDPGHSQAPPTEVPDLW